MRHGQQHRGGTQQKPAGFGGDDERLIDQQTVILIVNSGLGHLLLDHFADGKSVLTQLRSLPDIALPRVEPDFQRQYFAQVNLVLGRDQFQESVLADDLRFRRRLAALQHFQFERLAAQRFAVHQRAQGRNGVIAWLRGADQKIIGQH